MGNNKEALRWLLAELPKLRQDEVIDENTADALAKYCDDELALKAPPRKFIYTLFYIGAGMIAAGIVLFFKSNWYCFTRHQHLAIAAIPLGIALISALWTILGQKGQLWREFSAVLTPVAAGTLIAVVNQIYHVGWELSEFMALVLAIALPFVYIFNSIALATVYTFGMFLLLDGAPPLYCFFAVLAIQPILHIHLSHKSPDRVWARYLMILAALFGIISCGSDGYLPLSFFALAGTMLYAGWALSERHESYLRNPWLGVSFIFMLVCLAVASSRAEFFEPSEFDGPHGVWAYWLFTGVVLATNVRWFPKSHLDAKRLCTGLLVLLPLLHYCGVDNELMKLIFNVYMGVYGAVLMLDGFKRGRLLTYNGGLAMVLLLIVCRFFDAELSFLTRSIAFIAIGVVLITANFIFFRKRFQEAR